MIKIVKKIAVVAVLMIVSCTTQDGVLESIEQKFGRVGVICNVDSAVVFVDGVVTEVVTISGDTVMLDSIPYGSHEINLQLLCYQTAAPKMIVVQSREVYYLSFEMLLLDTVGNLFITSYPDSSQVVVDGLDRGYAPVLLHCLAAGGHQVDIKKAGYERVTQTVHLEGGKTDSLSPSLALKRLVLMEHFSSTSCIPCVSADESIIKVLDAVGSETVISISYHTEIPAPGDPMYLFARLENEARLDYYNVLTNPVVFVDGYVSEYGTSQLESRLSAAIAIRENIPPKAVLEIFNLEKNPSLIKGDLFVHPLVDLDAGLNVALIEKSVNFTHPPGQNGQTYFFDVLRRFWPAADGSRLSLTTGKRFQISFEFKLQDGLALDQLEVVAFLQDVETKEVQQAVSTLYP
ncbi:PEGA domain-containing protein [candidate division KSB1 bacterium]|nr:PEGA domain-containing protein [candidate division KSB1 bacterium]